MEDGSVDAGSEYGFRVGCSLGESFECVDVDGTERIEGFVLNGDAVVELVPSV
jgi:hypothetical protein